MADADGFEDFVRAHATELLRTATLLALGRDRGEELLQDTLTHLYPQWRRVAQAQAPMAYVRRVMVNRLISSARAPSRREVVMAEPPEPRPGPDPADALIERDAVLAMLSGLPQRQRAAVVLRYLDDLSDAQIAAVLGCRPVTGRSLISRGLAEARRRDHLSDVSFKAGA